MSINDYILTGMNIISFVFAIAFLVIQMMFDLSHVAICVFKR